MQSYRKAGLLLGNQGSVRVGSTQEPIEKGREAPPSTAKSSFEDFFFLQKSQMVAMELSAKCTRRHVWGNLAIDL